MTASAAASTDPGRVDGPRSHLTSPEPMGSHSSDRDAVEHLDVVDLTDEGPAPSTSLALATWALFASLGLMLAGSGLLSTLVGVRAELEGFPTLAIGVLSASYFGGFLAGSRLALHALGRVGHIRVYAALTSIMASAMLAIGLGVHPLSWIALRTVTGACAAGMFVVAESWLNQLATSANRGRIYAVYGIVNTVAFATAQLVFTQLDPSVLAGFAVCASLASLAVTPVALSAEAAPPPAGVPERMGVGDLFRLVPTGVVLSLMVGLAHGAFFGLSAVYATRSGLDVAGIGRFVMFGMFGSLVLQAPFTAASDDLDRRYVGGVAAAGAAAAAIGLVVVGPGGWQGLALMFLLGGTTYPLYAISGAYTTDWVPATQLTAAASSLVLLFGIGALTGPIITSITMAVVGPSGFVWTVAVLHGAIVVFLLVRVLQRPTPIIAKPWNAVAVSSRVLYVPVTAVSMGRRLRPRRTVRGERPTRTEV